VRISMSRGQRQLKCQILTRSSVGRAEKSVTGVDIFGFVVPTECGCLKRGEVVGAATQPRGVSLSSRV
jgi:hypothetical protein